MKLKVAIALITYSLLTNLCGLVVVLLEQLGYPKLWVMGYLVTAIFTIPILLVVQKLVPVSIWWQKADERSPREQLFVRMHHANLLLAGLVWAILITWR